MLSYRHNGLPAIVLIAMALQVATAQPVPQGNAVQSTQNLQGRFFTPVSLAMQLGNGNHPLVQMYLMGVYDLTQFVPDSECAAQDFIFRFVQPNGETSAWHLLGPMEKVSY